EGRKDGRKKERRKGKKRKEKVRGREGKEGVKKEREREREVGYRRKQGEKKESNRNYNPILIQTESLEVIFCACIPIPFRTSKAPSNPVRLHTFYVPLLALLPSHFPNRDPGHLFQCSPPHGPSSLAHTCAKRWAHTVMSRCHNRVAEVTEGGPGRLPGAVSPIPEDETNAGKVRV
ncbi:Transcription initiation factor TFIID subunit 3, partial [Ophiophagus hannah]